jgi:uncharacterized protein (DUF488 family)
MLDFDHRLLTFKLVSMSTLFTIGYEKNEPLSFLKLLKKHAVEMVVDVRDLPLSRKKGFSKHQLEAFLREAGIDYHHAKALGAPQELRHQLIATGMWHDYVKGFNLVLAQRGAEIDELIALVQKKRICLLCFERDPAVCHRSLIAKEVEKRCEKIRIHHIRY